uniref:Ig-like domain-containing protein n=1 Tax=Hippocampus comes TaxID=109280 RepID=A0A3Q2Y5C1_HIPCM
MFESHVDVLFVCLFFLSAIHSLENFVMVSTGIANLPDHVGVVYVDHIAVMYYDSKSRILEPRNNWMTEATADDLDFWERERNAFNQSEGPLLSHFRMPSNAFVILSGVHFGQARFGCEWDDQTDAVDAWEKMKYEDEHVMLLDVNTFTWTVEGPQALAIKHKFDFNELQRDLRKPCWLNKIHCLCLISCHVTFCAELPKVSLLQKMPSSPVTCHATGFYPYVADLFWRKDGEQLHEGVDYGQTLPNHDGTFQMTVDLKLEVTDEVEGQYECLFHPAGVQDEIVIKLERGNILSNARIEGEEHVFGEAHTSWPSATSFIFTRRTQLNFIPRALENNHRCRQSAVDRAKFKCTTTNKQTVNLTIKSHAELNAKE